MGFSTRTLYFFAFASLVAAAPAVAACSMSFDATAFAGGGGNSATSGETSGAGAFGNESDGSIDVAAPHPPADTKSPYASLCGGGCMDDGGLGCSFAGQDPDGAPAPQLSCQIVADDGSPSGSCLPAGDNVAGEVCLGAEDCAPGLGCVEISPGVSVCRQYCCSDVEACPKETYCAPRPMTEDGQPEDLAIPVCVPPIPCTLLEDGCDDGLVCAIVRADGTTSCIPPVPPGPEGTCPCAEGYVCLQEQNKCLQLCHVGMNSDCPAGMFCQGGSAGMPMNFGTCVGK